MRKTQKFIAGSSCPQCNEIDALLMDTIDHSIECVECGYTQTTDERDLENNSSPEIKREVPKKVDISNIIRINQIDE